MKQLFETDELIGKTIKGVFDEYDTQLVIVFDDETFAIVRNYYDEKDEWQKHGDDNAKTEICIYENDFDVIPSRKNYAKLFKYGMISQYVFDELDPYFKQMDADEAKEKADNIKREEIHKLQQLAQKYPDIATLK